MSLSELKTVSIFGVTGSVGLSSVEVISKFPKKFSVDTIVSKNNIFKLAKIAKLLKPKLVLIYDSTDEKKLKILLEGESCEVNSGESAIIEASRRKVDIFIAAIMGIAGLKSTLECISHVKILALANKESLVCLGKNIINLAKTNNCKIIPLDSEHNALFQLMNTKDKKFIRRLIITCSGGPATLMNKGLELIEAAYLFDILESKIDILVHPQSIIHGIVEYIDGSLKASMGTPDMRMPISYAINWPEREVTNVKELELSSVKSLTFDELDEEIFPAIKVSRSVIKIGGTAPTLLNAANEIAVKAFLNKRIKFLCIMEIIEEVLSKLNITQNTDLESIIGSDREARILGGKLIDNMSMR